MRVCFLGGFSGGGSEKMVSLLANELCQKENYVIHILSTGKKNVFYMNPNIFFYRLSSNTLLGRNKEVYHYIRKNKIEIFITVEAMTGIITILPAMWGGCKHIVWDHANYFQNQGSKYIKSIRQLELYIMDAYILLTKRDINNFKNNFRIKTRLEYIYNIANSQTSHPYDLDSKTIISVGHNRPIKNFTIIPDIAKIVFSKHPDWCWKIYGTPIKDEDEMLLRKISEFGLEDKIFLCGWRDSMEKEYQNAAMYVMTSLQEGLPMVLLEAKANKLPLISFDIETGPDEIIQDGINGFLIEAYNIENMAARINELIEDKELRREFSKKSVINLEYFSEQKIVEEWIELLSDL